MMMIGMMRGSAARRAADPISGSVARDRFTPTGPKKWL